MFDFISVAKARNYEMDFPDVAEDERMDFDEGDTMPYPYEDPGCDTVCMGSCNGNSMCIEECCN